MPPLESLPWDDVILPALLYLVLPSLVSAALVMTMVSWLGGPKQAPAGAALGISVGAVLGLCLHATIPAYREHGIDIALIALGDALFVDRSEWNRLPWVVLAALCIGRLAYLADVHASDGWLLRGGASLAFAYALVPENTRGEMLWLAPAFAAVMWAHWVILDALATRPASTSVALCMVLTLLAAGNLIVMHAHSGRLMGPLVALGFALAGVTLIAWWRGVEFSGALPAVAVALPAMLLVSQRLTSSKLHWTTFALPACAPFVLALTLPFSGWPKWTMHLVRLVLVCILLAVTMALAWDAEPIDFSAAEGE